MSGEEVVGGLRSDLLPKRTALGRTLSDSGSLGTAKVVVGAPYNSASTQTSGFVHSEGL